MLTKRDFYFCYSLRLKRYLESNGLQYICKGVSDDSEKTFWLYHRCNELKDNLDQWHKDNK